MSAEKADLNKNLVRRLFEEVFNAGELNTASVLLREDYIQHNPLVAPGLSGLLAFVADLRRAFPDLHFTIEDLVAEGDRVVARMLAEGTHQGEFLGIPATGRRTRTQSIDIFRVQDGRLAEHWDVLDLHGLLAQLGLSTVTKNGDRLVF